MPRRYRTGVCEGCNERKPTELYSDDWTTVLRTYEWCIECAFPDEE
jgi:hypothetical protein